MGFVIDAEGYAQDRDGAWSYDDTGRITGYVPGGHQGRKPEVVNRVENGRMIGERPGPGGNGTRSRYGAPKRPVVKEPTEKQTSWLNSMIEEIKGIDEELGAAALRLAADAAHSTGGRLTGGWGGSVSKAIDDVKVVLAAARRTARTAPRTTGGRPAYAPLPQVPAGYYAVPGEDGALKFYRVKITDRGRVYLDVQASDDLHRIPFGAYRAILGKIAQNPAAAGKAYADNLGRCYVCGRTLTDDESRSLGIGPKCRTL